MLKYFNINDLAKEFQLDRKLLTNEKVKSDGRKRELYEIVYSLVGALGIWAGIEPVVHFLQLLKVIEIDSNEHNDKTQQNNSDYLDFGP